MWIFKNTFRGIFVHNKVTAEFLIYSRVSGALASTMNGLGSTQILTPALYEFKLTQMSEKRICYS